MCGCKQAQPKIRSEYEGLVSELPDLAAKGNPYVRTLCCIAFALCMVGCGRHASRQSSYAERSADAPATVRTELARASAPEAGVGLPASQGPVRPSPFAELQKPDPAPAPAIAPSQNQAAVPDANSKNPDANSKNPKKKRKA